VGFLASFFIGSPLGRWVAGNARTLIVGAVIVAALVAAFFYVRNLQATITQHEATIASQQETIGAQKQQLQTQRDAVIALNKQLELQHNSQTVTDAAETQLVKVRNDNEAKTVAAVTKHDTYVRTVQADPTIGADAKDKLIASADVALLWQGHCALRGVHHPTCDQMQTPTAVEPPAPSGPHTLPPRAQTDPPTQVAVHPTIVPFALELSQA